MSFPLIGNSGVQNALTAAIKADRLPHAVLIEGIRAQGGTPLQNLLPVPRYAAGRISPAASAETAALKGREHTRIFTRPPPRTAKRI